MWLTYFSQCNEVTSSNAMELEGFKRGMSFLDHHNFTAEYVVTDRHPSIRKFMRTEKLEIYIILTAGM